MESKFYKQYTHAYHIMVNLVPLNNSNAAKHVL